MPQNSKDIKRICNSNAPSYRINIRTKTTKIEIENVLKIENKLHKIYSDGNKKRKKNIRLSYYIFSTCNTLTGWL